MRFGVVVFPGTWSDRDCGWVIEEVLGEQVVYLWHRDQALPQVDCVLLPGGFSYGDHLRPGAIARLSPLMEEVIEFSQRGGLVWGICNGFQVLCECGLLPGALIQNSSLEFRCQWTHLVCEHGDLPFTDELRDGQVIRAPISHGEGSFQAEPAALSFLEQRGQVVFRYCDAEGKTTASANPNGSAHNIAGITNKSGNVLGMMPHPERCTEAALGGTDGRLLFSSVVRSVRRLVA
ncbi:MAG: phosphoribosylformylglycinamidine synthase subunit PurQ [Candidatus Dormibacteraceae bacterium]